MKLLLRVFYVCFRPSVAGFLPRRPGFDLCGVGVNLSCRKCGRVGFPPSTSDLPYLDHPTFALYSYFFYLNLKSTPRGLCK
jgi:hypothetical protein